jgi:hypothetical protein
MKKTYFLILLTLCALTSVFSQSNRFSSIYLTTKPVFADTSAQILVRRHSDGQLILRHASSITGSLTGTGSANRIPYWTSSTALSYGPYWDNSNTRLGVGISPASPFHVLGGGTSTALANLSTTNSHRIDVANSALSLITGYLGSDNVFIQSYNNGTNTAKTLYINPFGGGIMTGALSFSTTPSTDNSSTVLSIDGSGNVTKRTNLSTLTNSGSANELVKSDGTNITGTGITSASTGALSVTGNFNFTATGDATINTGNTFGAHTNDASNTGITHSIKTSHQTTGTPSTGIGVGIELQTETSNNNVEIGSIIESVTTDATSTSEDFDLVFKNMSGGAGAIEALRIESDGDLDVAGLSLNLGNSSTSSSVRDINAIGSGSNITIQLTPKGTGSVTVTSGADLNVTGNTYITGTTNLTGRTTVGTGMAPDGTGLKHARSSTGVILPGNSATITVTWSTSFANANYTVASSLLGNSNPGLRILQLQNQVAASVDVVVYNDASVGLGTSGTIHLIAIHD